MTDAQWETLSNQAVAAAGVVYFLALLAYVVHWASLRDLPADVREPDEGRVAMAGRLGLLLTGIGALGPLRRAPRAAAWPRTPTGCRGATCTSSRSRGTFFVVLIFLLTTRRWRRVARSARRRLRAGRC